MFGSAMLLGAIYANRGRGVERERVKMSGSRRMLLHYPMFSLDFDTFIYEHPR
jgi:hypothetical protein